MTIGILLAGGSVIAFAAASPFLANYLATNDTLFTEVQEGTAKAVMKGDSFSHFVMSYQGRHFKLPKIADRNNPGAPAWEVLEHDPANDEEFDHRFWLTKWLGVYYVGIPPFRRIYKYQFKWNETYIDKKTHAEEIKTRDEETDFIYVSDFAYMAVLPAAENAEGLPLDVVFQMVIRITNPYKALFCTENWLEVVTGIALRRVRNYVGSRTYEKLLSETKEETGNVDFSCQLIDLTRKLPDDKDLANEEEDSDKPENRYTRGLRGKYGVTIVSGNLHSVEFTGALKDKMRETSIREYTAEKDAKAKERDGLAVANNTRIQGQAEADAILARGTAEANVIDLKGRATAKSLRYRAFALRNRGRLAELLIQTDAMVAEGAGRTIVWANNPFVSSVPGLSDLLGASGVQTPEQLKKFLRELLANDERTAA